MPAGRMRCSEYGGGSAAGRRRSTTAGFLPRCSGVGCNPAGIGVDRQCHALAAAPHADIEIAPIGTDPREVAIALGLQQVERMLHTAAEHRRILCRGGGGATPLVLPGDFSSHRIDVDVVDLLAAYHPDRIDRPAALFGQPGIPPPYRNALPG